MEIEFTIKDNSYKTWLDLEGNKARLLLLMKK